MREVRKMKKYRITFILGLMLLLGIGMTATAFGAELDENGVPKEGVIYTLTYPDGTVVQTDSYEQAKELESTWKKIYEGKTDKDGRIVLENWAKEGKIKILEKQVPEGYTADSLETEADLADGAVNIINSKTDVLDETEKPTGPKAEVRDAGANPGSAKAKGNSAGTGDSSHPAIWLLVALISAVCAGAVITRRRLIRR